MDNVSDTLFSQYVNAAEPKIGAMMVDVIDTARGLKHGAKANNLEISDDALLNAAVAIVLSARGEVSSDANG